MNSGRFTTISLRFAFPLSFLYISIPLHLQTPLPITPSPPVLQSLSNLRPPPIQLHHLHHNPPSHDTPRQRTRLLIIRIPLRHPLVRMAIPDGRVAHRVRVAHDGVVRPPEVLVEGALDPRHARLLRADVLLVLQLLRGELGLHVDDLPLLGEGEEGDEGGFGVGAGFGVEGAHARGVHVAGVPVGEEDAAVEEVWLEGGVFGEGMVAVFADPACVPAPPFAIRADADAVARTKGDVAKDAGKVAEIFRVALEEGLDVGEEESWEADVARVEAAQQLILRGHARLADKVARAAHDLHDAGVAAAAEAEADGVVGQSVPVRALGAVGRAVHTIVDAVDARPEDTAVLLGDGDAGGDADAQQGHEAGGLLLLGDVLAEGVLVGGVVDEVVVAGLADLQIEGFARVGVPDPLGGLGGFALGAGSAGEAEIHALGEGGPVVCRGVGFEHALDVHCARVAIGCALWCFEGEFGCEWGCHEAVFIACLTKG